MEFRILSKNEQADYENFIAAQPDGNFLQSWAWGSWQEQLDKRVERFGVYENQQLIAAGQLIINTVRKLRIEYGYIPYGFLASKKSPEISQQIVSNIASNFPRLSFLKIEPAQELSIKGRLSSRIQPGKTITSDLSQSEAILLKNMHPKTRYNIKVGQRRGIQIHKLGKDQIALIREAAQLIYQTARRQKYHDHGYDYYINLYNHLQRNPDRHLTAEFYCAFHEQEMLAAELVVDCLGTRTYLFGGTAENKKNLMAPYQMHWEVIKDAKKKGLKKYDWWGIETSSGETPGFVRFKLGWGGEVKNYPSAIDIVLKPLWYNSYNVFKRLQRLI